MGRVDGGAPFLRRRALRVAQDVSRAVTLAALVATVLAATYTFSREAAPANLGPSSTIHPPTQPSAGEPTLAPSLNATPMPSPSATPVPYFPGVGVVAGHWGSDSGAECPDGLTEVEINLEIARRVVYTLQALGYRAELLEEFDDRLQGYRADALVSIHTDSCIYPEASGFKVARVEDSAVPETEDRLVDCLARHYAARTGLLFHANSITYDMTRYHTFYEIDSRTPGAIIEVGFMLSDRELLVNRPDLVARGIVDGIICFLEGE